VGENGARRSSRANLKLGSKGVWEGVRMACEFDIWVKLHAVKLKSLCALDDGIPKRWSPTENVYLRNAKTPDGVPYADEFDGDIGDSLVFCRQLLDSCGIEGVVDVPAIDLAEPLETGLCH